MNSQCMGVKWTAALVGVSTALCWVLPSIAWADETDPPVGEFGLQCIDGVDNDQNGTKDCDEPACQAVEYCLEKIYYTPEPAHKPMGLFMSLGGGLALPNWRPPEAEGQVDSSGNRYVVPYLPDIGPMADLTVAHFFLPWMGIGLKGMVAGTNVQSRDKWYEEDHYKFDGVKIYMNLSAVVRFQHIMRRLVPYVNLVIGYSYVQYRWVTFTRFGEETDTMMSLDRIIEPPSRHVTFAAEIGADLFIIPRTIAIGAKAVLPFAATGGSGMDNTALLLTVTYTPMWKSKRAIRPHYLKKMGMH